HVIGICYNWNSYTLGAILIGSVVHGHMSKQIIGHGQSMDN
ncbi:3038_t:CDS:1, partial [Gigaspora margarita]